MVVVADTSPINYLVLIGQIDLLTRLYTRILIPPAVLAELKHPLAPKPVRNWACDGRILVFVPRFPLLFAGAILALANATPRTE